PAPLLPLAILLFSMLPRPPTSTLFPYTTLFRSFSQKKPAECTHHLHLHAAPASNPLPALIPPLLTRSVVANGETLQAPTPPNSTDRKSTRLNSSHVKISYAVFCLKKKKIRSTTL